MSAAPFLGVLMLETDFTRYPGDIGNPATFSFPVRYKVVEGATPRQIVGISDDRFLEPFVEAGQELAQAGAIGLSTSCGFLSAYQKRLAARLPVPVLASSLALLPLIELSLPRGRHAGILTISAESLHPVHLADMGITPRTPIRGLPEHGRFQAAIRHGRPEGDSFAAREAEAVAAARQLVEGHADIGCILCECTNLAPHSAAISRAVGLPVHDIVTALNWFWSGLRPREFSTPA